ncbi:MAG: DUF1828 domain-containing protein [Streptococcaceae bacterium]|jgi:hypothetical protein|nr:DUF1828 domain-containing protein [Streptococcaceae bacterium]
MGNAKKLKSAYFDWLFNEYSYSNLDKDIVRIDAPFFDNDFDYIVMYAEFHKNNDKITLTDDGWTINNLESHGVSFNKNATTRIKLLNDIVDNLGVNINNGELSITSDIANYPIIKQRLLQSIIQVNDLAVLANKNVKNIFFEEVELFLRSKNILFARKPAFSGKEGITVQFDFSIPTERNEKLIRTISNGNDLNRAKVLSMDTHILKNFKKDAQYIALIDDENNNFTKLNEVNAIFEENASNKILLLPKTKMEKNIELLSNTNIAS